MTRRIGRYAGLAAGALGLTVLLISAWRDGGEEPLRAIAQPVPVPELP